MEFYRYEIKRYSSSSYDDYGSYDYPRKSVSYSELNLIIYNLYKETPKGYWIGFGKKEIGFLHSESIWVSKTSRKRFAYPTKKEALVNYIKRTEIRSNILKSQYDECECGIKEAKQLIESL